MMTILNQKPSAIDDLVEANIKCVLAGRRLEFFGADPGTRERLLLGQPGAWGTGMIPKAAILKDGIKRDSWRSRCRGDGVGVAMVLRFSNTTPPS